MGATYGTLSASGETDVVVARGPVVLKATGDWGGGTLTIQRQGKDTAFKTLVTETELTTDATGEVLIDFPEGTVSLLKATLSGSTDPDLDWEFIGNVLSTDL